MSQILITNLLFGGHVKNVGKKWGLSICNFIFPGSQWPRGLRRGSAAARFLGLRVRIPPGHGCLFLSVVCCQVEVSATGCSLVKRSLTERGVSGYDLAISSRTRAVEPLKNIFRIFSEDNKGNDVV